MFRTSSKFFSIQCINKKNDDYDKSIEIKKNCLNDEFKRTMLTIVIM